MKSIPTKTTGEVNYRIFLSILNIIFFRELPTNTSPIQYL